MMVHYFTTEQCRQTRPETTVCTVKGPSDTFETIVHIKPADLGIIAPVFAPVDTNKAN